MNKAKLIELLNALPDGAEVKLWNGFAQDWVEIAPEIVPTVLVRMTKAYWLESCRLEDCRDGWGWDYQMPADEVAELSKKYPKVCKWEINEYVTQEDIAKKRYSAKTVHIMQATIKGENSWDRMGNMEY